MLIMDIMETEQDLMSNAAGRYFFFQFCSFIMHAAGEILLRFSMLFLYKWSLPFHVLCRLQL